jgi:hypothetical protein
MAAHLRRRFATTALALLPLAAVAQPLADPTQPPPGYGVRDGAPGPAAPRDARADEREGERRLQMIVRGPGELRTAVIGGVSVRAGDPVDIGGQAMRIERITDDAVHLVRGTRRATLELLPAASKAVRCASTRVARTGC